MGLYIGGALTIHAKLNGYNDWEIFDKEQDNISRIADKFNLFVSRASINDHSDRVFIISNSHINYESLYASECFEIDFSIKQDDSFIERAYAFIDELNRTANTPEELKNLKWSQPAARYYTFS